MEDCPDGELTKEQFVDMYMKIFPGGNAEKFSENVFRIFDTDRSGTIDFKEASALILTQCKASYSYFPRFSLHL